MQLTQSRRVSASSAGIEHVSQTELDERLARHADPARLPVDFTQQVDRKVHVDALHFLAGSSSLVEIQVGRKVLAAVVQSIEFVCRQAFSAPGTALLPRASPDGPR